MAHPNWAHYRLQSVRDRLYILWEERQVLSRVRWSLVQDQMLSTEQWGDTYNNLLQSYCGVSRMAYTEGSETLWSLCTRFQDFSRFLYQKSKACGLCMWINKDQRISAWISDWTVRDFVGVSDPSAYTCTAWLCLTLGRIYIGTGVTVGIIICIVVALVTACCCWRCRKRMKARPLPTEPLPLQLSQQIGEAPPAYTPVAEGEDGGNLPLYTPNDPFAVPLSDHMQLEDAPLLDTQQ